MSIDDVVEMATDAILHAAKLDGVRITTGQARTYAMAVLIAMDLVNTDKNQEHG